MEKIDGLSKDIEKTERKNPASVFPQCFVEGKLNIDKLLSLCGEYTLKDFDKYEFTWKGKSECLPLAQQRSIGNKKTAYSIGDDCLLIICLANNLTTEMIEEMAEYTPGQIILAEHALADLSAMRNAYYVLRDRNIELKLV